MVKQAKVAKKVHMRAFEIEKVHLSVKSVKNKTERMK